MPKFEYGNLPRTLKAKGHLPGVYTYAFGPRYVDVAFWDSSRTDTAEFGEFVEINAGDTYANEALPVSDSTTAAELAMVVRDVAGFPALGGGILYGPKENVPLSVFIGVEGNKGRVVGILGEQGTTPAVDGQVYVGTGETSADITAGSFVVGTPYTIKTVGTTDYTLIGATSNTVGVTFIATGVGAGTGTATFTSEPGTVYTTDLHSVTLSATNWKFAGTKFAPTTSGKYVVEVKYEG